MMGPTNRLNGHKVPENISCTIVKYGETFYDRHTARTPDNICFILRNPVA